MRHHVIRESGTMQSWLLSISLFGFQRLIAAMRAAYLETALRDAPGAEG